MTHRLICHDDRPAETVRDALWSFKSRPDSNAIWINKLNRSCTPNQLTLSRH